MNLKLRGVLERLLLTAVTTLFLTFFRGRFGLAQTKDYLTLIGILLALYFVVVPFLLWVFSIVRRQYNRLVPKIGILNGYLEDAGKEHKCVPKTANIAGIVWEHELRKTLSGMHLKRIRRMYTREIDTSFALIMNPYGENYPESDKDLRSTFQSIRAYMRDGGVFFASGAPFWFHQNTITDKDGQWSVVRTTDGIQQMTDGLCFTSLGVSVTMPDDEPSEVEVYQRDMDQEISGDLVRGPTKVKRWRAVLSNTPDCLPILREKNDSSYPLCLVQYNKGFLLHSGLYVKDENAIEFQIIVRLLKALIATRFRQLSRW